MLTLAIGAVVVLAGLVTLVVLCACVAGARADAHIAELRK